MKKFSKLFALSLAAALTFGMTVNAASPDSNNASAEAKAMEEKVDVDTGNVGGLADAAVTVVKEPTSDTVIAAVEKYADDVINTVDNSYDAKSVVSVFDMSLVKAGVKVAVSDVSSGSVTITFTVAGTDSSKTYWVLHQEPNGSWKKVGQNSGATFTATFTNLSPVAIVEVDTKDTGDGDDGDGDDGNNSASANTASANAASGTTASGAKASPKTGEAMPVAVLFAVASLGAAVVCSKKAGYNK